MSSASRTHPAGPFGALLGIEFETEPDGRLVAKLRAGEHLHNPAGVVHGGVAMALVDTAMGAVVHTRENPEGHVFLSTDVHVRYLRSVRADELRASAEIEAATPRTRLLSGRVWRASDGELVCLATAAYRRAG